MNKNHTYRTVTRESIKSIITVHVQSDQLDIHFKQLKMFITPAVQGTPTHTQKTRAPLLEEGTGRPICLELLKPKRVLNERVSHPYIHTLPS